MNKISKQLLKIAKELIAKIPNNQAAFVKECPGCSSGVAGSGVFIAPYEKEGCCRECGEKIYRYPDGTIRDKDQNILESTGVLAIKMICPDCGMQAKYDLKTYDKNNPFRCQSCGLEFYFEFDTGQLYLQNNGSWEDSHTSILDRNFKYKIK